MGEVGVLLEGTGAVRHTSRSISRQMARDPRLRDLLANVLFEKVLDNIGGFSKVFLETTGHFSSFAKKPRLLRVLC